MTRQFPHFGGNNVEISHPPTPPKDVDPIRYTALYCAVMVAQSHDLPEMAIMSLVHRFDDYLRNGWEQQ